MNCDFSLTKSCLFFFLNQIAQSLCCWQWELAGTAQSLWKSNAVSFSLREQFLKMWATVKCTMPEACCTSNFRLQQWSLNNTVGTICSALMCKICEAHAAFVELTYKLLIYYLMEFSKSSKAAFSCQNVLYSALRTALEAAQWCFTLMK